MVVVHTQNPDTQEVNVVDLKLEVEPQNVYLKDED